MRFDTRDKKPDLYALAVITLITVALTVFLACLKIHDFLIYALIAGIYLVTVLYVLMRAFVMQLEYNPYSYNSIYYIGFFLFALAQLFFLAQAIRYWLEYPEYYSGLSIIHMLLGSAKNFMFVTAPLLFVFAVILCVSNTVLIIKEGFSFTNVLGLILAVLLTAGEIFLFVFDYYVTGSQRQVMYHELVANTFAAVYLYFECMLLGAAVIHTIVIHYEPDYDRDFMIVLGCGLNRDGTPLPLLQGRIDRALEFYCRQKETTGKELTFITSGGQGPDEIISESKAMKNYLMEHGIPEDRIIMEDRSASTFENMQYSKEKIMERDPEGKIAFATTGYHVFRSGVYARRNKMRAQGVAAHTKWYFWPNAAVREFVGLLTAHKVKQAAVLLSMIAVYIILTLVVYGYY